MSESSPVDLRSDTVTKPDSAMREVMAAAEVGDDVFGEDPSILKLEATVAALAGKEAAVFVPSGTMANQLALRVHTRHGDSVIAPPGAHVHAFESGGGAALAGVQFDLSTSWKLTPQCVATMTRTGENHHYSPTTLLWVENTHNRAGGCITTAKEMKGLYDAAKERNLSVHIDGARLWNAIAAGAGSLADFGAAADTISLCMSKGLGAPVGSLLVGSQTAVERARRFRKMYGGGMRQGGILAAGAAYALEHHHSGLVQDHQNAAVVAEVVGSAAGVSVSDPETNIVFLNFQRPIAPKVVELAAGDGVMCLAMSTNTIRLVFHRDVSSEMAKRAASVLRSACESAHLAEERA